MALNEIDALRRAVLQRVLALKQENAPRMEDPAWTNDAGYNHGRWADKGFGIALGLLNASAWIGEAGEDYLRRVAELMREQRDAYHRDAEDEGGACRDALDAAMWAISDVLQGRTAEERLAPPPVASPTAASVADPAPDAAWKMMYTDLFDRECPPSVVGNGCGLVKGLTDLWKCFLSETVTPGGAKGLSRFGLRWEKGAVGIDETDLKRAVPLREWVYGAQDGSAKGDPTLLEKIAAAHAPFAVVGLRVSGQILDAAAEAADQRDFEIRLTELSRS